MVWYLLPSLLLREGDVAADGLAASLKGALVAGLHDARAATGDDGEARLGEKLRGALGGLVVGVFRAGAGRAEDGDGLAEVGKGLEALDELGHDPEDPPTVAGVGAGGGVGVGQ